MKSIQIKSLHLTNFKGIRNLSIEEFGKETNIFGDNGTGKTSIFDAFTWLLFGKNSQDQTTFEIKTLDKNNNVIEKIDHEVSATLIVDGEPIDIKRTLREKWVTKRGYSEPEFSGNETVYHWNDVPMLAKDFTAKVNSIVDEKVFKMITNPLAFNSLKWQEQRQVLIDITGGVTDTEVAEGNSDFGQLLSKLTNKSLDEYQKQVAASIRKSKNEIKMLPTRIDEVERGKPEAKNFKDIEEQIKSLEKERAHLDDKMQDELKAQQSLINDKKQINEQINELDLEIDNIKHAITKKAREEYQSQSSGDDAIIAEANNIKSQMRNTKSNIVRDEASLKQMQNDMSQYSSQMDRFRKEWEDRNAEEFKMDESDSACPTCKRKFDADKIEQKRKDAEEQFKLNKKRDLATINSKGMAKKQLFDSITREAEKFKAELEKSRASYDDLQSKHNTLTENISNSESNDIISLESILQRLLSEDKTIETNKEMIERLKEDLAGLDVIDVSELKETRNNITTSIKALSDDLSARETISKADERIEELKRQEKVLAQEIASEEKEQFVIENFIRAKVDKLEALINEKFNMVRFKMFDTQINGGQTETCKALIDGVPFNDANTASKINAGIDIINTLCDHYGVNAPIFIDNRESVVQLLPTQSQLVNLIVSEADNSLRVNVNEPINQLQTALI